MTLRKILLQLFTLITFATEFNAKLRGTVLEDRTDLTLYPDDYDGSSSGDQRPYLKKLGFNIFGNKKNGSVVSPKDDFYNITNRRRKGKKGSINKGRTKKKIFMPFYKPDAITTEEEEEETTVSPVTRTRSRLRAVTVYSRWPNQEYFFDIWPVITLSQRPTISSRRTMTLSSYFPSALVTVKTKAWRFSEWSRGPTGPDDLYYNFYNDYYVTDHVGRLNTYQGPPPKCLKQAFKVDGHVVNIPIREGLYDGLFLDYLKDRVQSYSTWSAYVKANPCFTRLAKFFGTTKILALFAARPLMLGKDPNEVKPIELYRKDYVVLTEPVPTTTSFLGLFMMSRPEKLIRSSDKYTTVEEYVTERVRPFCTSKTNLDYINEDDIISELMASDDMTRTKLITKPTRSRLEYELRGSLRTRLYCNRNKNKSNKGQTNIVTPETWTPAADETTNFDDWLSMIKEKSRRKLPYNSKHHLKSVKRYNLISYDAERPPRQGSYTICHSCRLEHNVRDSVGTPGVTCHDMYQNDDQRSRGLRRDNLRQCFYEEGVNIITSNDTNNLNHFSSRYRPGCTHRFLDVPSVYDDRYCRMWPPDDIASTFASERYQRLEKLLRFTENGCVASPLASLTPLGRGISLWVRYHVCVCSSNYCNGRTRLREDMFVVYGSLVVLVVLSSSEGSGGKV